MQPPGFAAHRAGQLLPSVQLPVQLANPGGEGGPERAGGARPAPSGGAEEPHAKVAATAASAFELKAQCPMDFAGEKERQAGQAEGAVQGPWRVSRHPSLMAMAAFCAGAAVATPYATGVALFAPPVAFALIGGAHLDHRFRAGSGGVLTPEKEAVTSLLPFVALVEGRQSWSALVAETKWSNAALGVAVAMLLHGRRGQLAARRALAVAAK